ncbi:MAG: hypothetical protein C4293_20970, partial [Nitrospiraceae bacterium]
LIAVRLLTEPEPQRVPLTYKSGQVAARKEAKEAAGFPTLIRPKKANEISFREPKNIFAALEHPSEKQALARPRMAKKPMPENPVAIAPPTHPALEPPPPSPEELAAQEARRQQELAAQQARQQMAQYRFLGYLSQNGEQRAFLGKGKDIYIVRSGDTVEGKILVKTIDASAIQLADTGTRLEATIPLSKDNGGTFFTAPAE